MVKKKISVEDAANQIDTSEQLDLKFATIKPKDNKSRGMDIKIQNKDPAYEIKSVDKANKGSGIKTSAAPVQGSAEAIVEENVFHMSGPLSRQPAQPRPHEYDDSGLTDDLGNQSGLSGHFNEQEQKHQHYLAYGANTQKRYNNDYTYEDENNMTVMTQNLNDKSGISMHKKGKQSIGAILTTDGGDETFDIELAQAQIKKKHRDRKQAQGTSTDIFNTSSYGNVKMQ